LHRPYGIDVEALNLLSIRYQLLALDAEIAGLQETAAPLYSEGDPRALSWLNYYDEVRIIPIYNEAIALMRMKPLFRQEEVQNIVRFISVPGSMSAVDDPEEHGHGHHFHYGKTKKNRLIRYNVVLTFDRRKPAPQQSHDPLFSEEHGSGRYQHVDVSLIGQNVRYPVYKICEAEMKRIGRDKFKVPANKAQLFY
jgi:hypothetical protein